MLQVAAAAGVPTLIIERERFAAGDGYTAELWHRGIDLIILAGFLWKVPLSLIEAYPHRIINIHPALLPRWGGKGMYGAFVHEAVIGAAEPQSGITIHYVDEHYDHGDTIFQATCPVTLEDTAESLAKKVHELEHRHYPEVIEKIVTEISQGAS